MKHELSGKRFGRLLVIEKSGVTPNGIILWKCLCDCGNIVSIRSTHLVNGKTKSCGCFQRDVASKLKKSHGLSDSRLFMIWQAMKQRCNNSNSDYYKFYGGKGIKICAEWESDFLSFYNWSISNGYTDKLTIDRIDINKGYSPDNCRWATASEQSNNKSDVKYVTYHGAKGSFTDMCRKLNVNRSTIQYRCREHKLTFEEAIDNFPNTSQFVEHWKN